MEIAEPADCESGTPDAFCDTSEQAGNVQGNDEADGMAAADSRDSFGTVDHTHNDTAGTIVDPGTVKLKQPLAPNGTTDDAEEMEAPDCSVPEFCRYGKRTNSWHTRRAPKIKVSSTARRRTGTFRPHFWVLEMWRVVGGQPTCIETEGNVRVPVEDGGQTLCTVSLEDTR